MKNTLAKTFTCALFLSAATVAHAQTYTWNYTLDASDKATITGVSPEPEGAITIPTTLDGHAVIGIGAGAFANCTNLTSVNIPAGVTIIAEKTFESCVSITNIVVPKSVQWIDKGAFAGCSGLESITLPFVGRQRGDGDEHHFGIIFGDTEYPGCTLADQWHMGGMSFTRKPSYVPSSLRSVSITDDTAFGCGAFSVCRSIESISLPPTLTWVDYNAFAGCDSLHRVDITDLSAWSAITFTDRDTSNPLVCAHDLYLNGTLVTSVVLSNETGRIGDNAFNGATNITDVTIADGIGIVGSGAFCNCTAMTNVTVAASVESVGDYAFDGCVGLKSVHVFDLARWCEITFGSWDRYWTDYDTRSRTANPLGYAHDIYLDGELVAGDVEISNDVARIRNFALYGCTNITSLTVPDSVTNIGCGAFLGCTSLTNMVLPFVGQYRGPGGGQHEGEFCFVFCGSNPYFYCQIPPLLRSITITDDTAFSSGGYWGGGAFQGMANVTDITLPETLTDLGSWTFSGCSSLTNVNIPAGITVIGTATFSGCSSFTNIDFLPEGITSIAPADLYAVGVFQGCSSLAEIMIPQTVTNIGAYAFNGCTSLTHIDIPSAVTAIGERAFYNCSQLRYVEIPSAVTSIGYYAFIGCGNLTGVYITDLSAWCRISFEYGGNPLSCARCLYLNGEPIVSDITIPSDIEKLRPNVFNGCTNLASVVIGDNVTAIGDAAFANCGALTNFVFGSAVETIGDEAFWGCGSLTDVAFPNSVTNIGNRAFVSCTALKNLAIPDSVETIGERAFNSCQNLMSVVVPGSVVNLSADAFSGCVSLTNVILQQGVETIGQSAFSGCRALETISIPSSLTASYRWSFHDCRDIKAVYITDFDAWNKIRFETVDANPTYYGADLYINGAPILVFDTDEDVKDNAHVGQKITHVYLRDGVTTIGASAFANCTNLVFVSMCETLTNISASAFSGCRSLPRIDWPASVASVGRDAFYGCSSLDTVNITNLEAWCTTSFANDAANPLSRAHNLYLDDVLLEDLTVPDGVESISAYAFTSCNSITNVSLAPETWHVGNYAFANCANLAHIDLAEAESIGYCAFRSCPELAEVHIPVSVTNFGEYAFSDCAKFAKIDIESLDAWYDIDFEYAMCNPLYYARNLYVNGAGVTDLVVPESVEAIKQYAFYNATNIATVAIPATLALSGSGSFNGCTGVTSVSITNLAAWCGVSFANREANPLFYAKNLLLDGTTLRGVTLPAGVTSVGGHAFVNCTNIVRLSVLGADTQIPSSAFYGCTGVSSVLTPRALEGRIAAIFPNAEEAYRATNMEEPAVIADNGIKILSKRLIDEELGIWELTLDITLESGVGDTFDDDAIKVVSAPTAKKLRAIDAATVAGDEHMAGSVEVEEKAAVSFNVVPEIEGAPRQFYRLVVETSP